MRDLYEDQLQHLYAQMLEMGALCQTAISKATQALTEGDIVLAQEIIEGDAVINKKERDIESLCFQLILQQQPVAGDLRRISAILKFLTDLERIGDQAADIAEIILSVSLKLPSNYLHICKMGTVVIKMIEDALKAYVDKDLALAKEVIAQDDIVDDLFMEIRKEILDELASGNVINGEILLDLLMITKYYEKIGDHATNVAEWVCYSLTGARA